MQQLVQKRRRRRAITLIEIMIVMFLIALIGGVVAYNTSGAVDQGKVFKTEQGMKRLKAILEMHLAEYPEDSDRIESDWPQFVERSPLGGRTRDLILDGWGRPYEVRVNEQGEVQIRSEAYERYQER
jgi:type II secretory pathway pseudopilin PulG